MTTHDPYDPAVAFDDVYGAPPESSVASALLRRCRASRLGPLPLDVEVIGHDPTPWTFCVPEVVGDTSASAGTPVFDALRTQFSRALPQSKIIRLDDEGSYSDFRNGRRAPYLDKLASRLAALETAFQSHITDHHGGGRVASLEERMVAEDRRLSSLEHAFDDHVRDPHALGEEVLGAVDAAIRGGSRVLLPLPDWARGKVECWQDGPEVLCTVRVLGPGGPLLATTGTPLDRNVEEVLGHADALGADAEDVIVAVPVIAPVVAAERALSEVCGAVPSLVGKWKGRPVVAEISSRVDPALAAAMALLQRCQQGDRAACADAYRLARTRGDLVNEARECLLRGQREKAEGRV